MSCAKFKISFTTDQFRSSRKESKDTNHFSRTFSVLFSTIVYEDFDTSFSSLIQAFGKIYTLPYLYIDIRADLANCEDFFSGKFYF